MIIFGKTLDDKIIPIRVDANGVLQIGGSIMETPHDLLDGVINEDTVANVPTRGAIIVGVDTGGGNIKWSMLEVGDEDQSIFVSESGDLEFRDVAGGAVMKHARIFSVSNQSIAHDTPTFLEFTNESYDTDGCFTVGTDPTKLVFNTAGKYLVGGSIFYDGNPSGLRGLALKHNSGTNIARDIRAADQVTGTYIHVSTPYIFAVNDYIQLEAYQDSGGAVDSLSSEVNAPQFWLIQIG